MWIDFECALGKNYMIKIYVGGVNAISGEPAVENAGTKLRRQNKVAQGGSLQDYVVVPGQHWLDGIATSDGTVRQFVAMPFGSGHSVELQINGQDAAGGIQVEITPYKEQIPARIRRAYTPHLSGDLGDEYQIFVSTLAMNFITVIVRQTDTIDSLKCIVDKNSGIPVAQQRLIFGGKQLRDDWTLMDYDIKEKCTVFLVLAIRGGGPEPPEMTIAAGGKIRQVIRPDYQGDEWLADRTTVFNVQILNSVVYQSVTGSAPPSQPMDAQTYKQHGFPFFDIYEEPSGVSGDFSMVKSVGQIDKNQDDEITPGVVTLGAGGSTTLPIRLTNPNGPLCEFRTVRDLRKEYSSYHVANF
jgi:hypothetical protein